MSPVPRNLGVNVYIPLRPGRKYSRTGLRRTPNAELRGTG